MARSRRGVRWGTSLQRSVRRSLQAFTRAALRNGAQAIKPKAKPRAKPKPMAKPRPKSAVAADWIDGIAVSAAGARRYRLYRPPGRARETLPLLVMLHGCHQDAASFARSTRVQRLAAREGVVVLCPEQARLANSQGCWNWFDARSGRADREAASIVAAIDQTCARHGADATRVVVAGMSAGASMAMLLALTHPLRFAAVATHSGVPPGAAHSAATALTAMRGRRRPAALPAEGVEPLPPLLVIHGTLDSIVDVRNARAAVQLWADATGAQASAARAGQRGARYPSTRTDFRRGTRLVATLCEVASLGHAWSGGAPGQPYSDPKGPDATRLIWAFASRCFARAQSAAKQ